MLYPKTKMCSCKLCFQQTAYIFCSYKTAYPGYTLGSQCSNSVNKNINSKNIVNIIYKVCL